MTTARRRRKTRFAGAGCFVQALGLALIIAAVAFWPLALFGLILLAWGSSLSTYWVCGACGNPIAKTARLCPHCRTPLS